MSDPKTTIPLSLGFGLLLGFGAAQLIGAEDPGENAPSDLTMGTVQAAEGEAQGADEAGLLRAEVERLAAQLAATTSDGGRERVSATAESPTQPMAGPEALVLGDPSEGLGKLLDEFASKTYRDTQQELGERDGVMSIAMSVFYTYRNANRLHECLRIKDLIEAQGMENENWQLADWDIGSLAEAFREAGDEATATRLYMDALRRSPDNWEWAMQLAELDPAGGLALLRELQGVEGATENTFSMARLLAGSGDLEGALELLRKDGRKLDGNGWDLFMEFDPEAAEAELIAAAKGDDPYNEMGLRLARHLIDTERPELAIAELERMLLGSPENPELIELLSSLDAERGIELLAQQVAAHPNTGANWTRYAELLSEAGRTEEAIEANLRAFELSGNGWIPGNLLELAPERVLPIFQERADASVDDELWGDLGDAYWQSGQQEQAKIAWEKARKFDSDDGEWINKLANIGKGVDPFGNNDVSFTGSSFGFPGDFGIVEDFEVVGY